MLRAAAHLSEPPSLQAWPGEHAKLDEWQAWLRAVWDDEDFRRAVTAATADLSHQVEDILAGRQVSARRAKRAALAIAKYAIRYAHRATPFGLFAGVSLIDIAGATGVRIGDAHQSVARPDPRAINVAINGWESVPEQMAALDVCVNNLMRQQDGRVYVPDEGDSEFSIAMSPAVRMVIEEAQQPIRLSTLAEKLTAEFSASTEMRRLDLLRDLLKVRLLRSELRAPATMIDPSVALPAEARAQVNEHPPALDLRLDGDVRLPHAVLT